MEFVSPEGLRVDGRRPKELRALSASLGTLDSADGSATFQMGNTKVRATLWELLYCRGEMKGGFEGIAAVACTERSPPRD